MSEEVGKGVTIVMREREETVNLNISVVQGSEERQKTWTWRGD